jgi:hypothetical protein
VAYLHNDVFIMYFSEGICSARCSDAIKVQYRMQNHKKSESAEKDPHGSSWNVKMNMTVINQNDCLAEDICAPRRNHQTRRR